jgi:NitT/TauT family transport system substrate-binding protein
MGTPADRICARLGAELSLCMRSIGVVGLAALALLAAIQASSAADRVRVAITAGLADAPTIVAKERGYFAQENIELEPVVFASAAQAIVPLASKELDVAGGAVSASLYNAIDRGVNLKAVAGRSRTSPGIPYITVFIRKDHIDSGRFKTLADLKGMKFALIARGIAVHALFEAMLKSGPETGRCRDRLSRLSATIGRAENRRHRRDLHGRTVCHVTRYRESRRSFHEHR